MTNSSDDRSPLAEAAAWASHVTTIALEMVIPGIIGVWIDRQLGTVLLFLLLGIILGMTAGIMQLARLRAEPDRGDSSDEEPSNADSS